MLEILADLLAKSSLDHQEKIGLLALEPPGLEATARCDEGPSYDLHGLIIQIVGL